MSLRPCLHHVSARRRQRRGRVLTVGLRDLEGPSKWGSKCTLVGVEILILALISMLYRFLVPLKFGGIKLTIIL